MPIDSVVSFIQAIRTHRLLDASQMGEMKGWEDLFSDPRGLARELIDRNWMTPYQVNQLFLGKGSRLLFGQYVVLERLGEGGMGQVFKARHHRLKRLAALKLIRPERLTSPEIVERFRRETLAAARLSHPNIVAVYDADEADGIHFLAMEYVEVVDLARSVRNHGPLPSAQACDFVRQAAMGLQHAYEKNLVHRDIKPHNLLVTSEGVVKLLDMGLARLNPSLQDCSIEIEALTRDGSILGTPDYIAPEQAMSSHTVDIRADLYSLGCTFYFLLAGQAPFAGGSIAEKLLKHQLAEPQPIEQLRPGLPTGIAVILRRLMCKDPAQRYQTPAELILALADLDRNKEPNAAAAVAVPQAGTPPGQPVSKSVWLIEEQPTPAWEASVSNEPTLSEAEVPGRRNRYQDRRWYAAALLVVVVGAGLLFHLTRDHPEDENPTPGIAEKDKSKDDPLESRKDRPSSDKTEDKGKDGLPKKDTKPPEKDKVEPKPPDLKYHVLDLGDGVKLKMVRVGKGKFWMGSPPDEKPREDKFEEQKEVDIKTDFYLGVYEVTHEQWEAVMGKSKNPSGFSREGEYKNEVKDLKDDELKTFPVESVSWEYVQEFLKKLNEKEKHSGWVYRLPKEVEWEYACRGGPLLQKIGKRTAPFVFANPAFSLSFKDANFNGEYPFGDAPRGLNLKRPCKTGEYQANLLGLYDMHGNVAEWCDDFFEKDQGRVYRGGSWMSTGASCRAAYRHGWAPESRMHFVGFRLAGVPPPDE